MYGTWHVFCYLGEETISRTKFVDVEYYTLKGGNSMPCFISPCPSYSFLESTLMNHMLSLELSYMHDSTYGDTMTKRLAESYGWCIVWHVMCEGMP